MNTLTVDPRAGSKTLIEPLRALGIRVEVEQMSFGDVSWLGNGPEGPICISVEHKDLEDDVLKCVRDGRFAAHQLQGLQDCYEIIYLVVQGEWKRGSSGELLVKKGRKWRSVEWGRKRWKYAEVRHWLSTMRFQGGVILAETRDVEDSAAFIKTEFTWWSKAWADHKSLRTFHTIPPPLRKPGSGLRVSNSRPGVTRRMAKELPGVRWELSERVAAHFGTPRKMTNATVEDWMQIEGIGKGKAKMAAYLCEHGTENGRQR